LLGIDIERSHEFEREITRGCEGIKPGWVRVNFNYFISEAVFDYIVEAVRLVAQDGWRMMGRYRFDVGRGIWVHRDGPVEPPLRLAQITYRPDGAMSYPRHGQTADESALKEYLEESARLLLATTPPDVDSVAERVSPDFEHLRWFDLPPACLLERTAPA
jgi:hypothetical protein